MKKEKDDIVVKVNEKMIPKVESVLNKDFDDNLAKLQIKDDDESAVNLEESDETEDAQYYYDRLHTEIHEAKDILQKYLQENNAELLVDILQMLITITKEVNYSSILHAIKTEVPGILEYDELLDALSIIGLALDGRHGFVKSYYRCSGKKDISENVRNNIIQFKDTIFTKVHPSEEDVMQTGLIKDEMLITIPTSEEDGMRIELIKTDYNDL